VQGILKCAARSVSKRSVRPALFSRPRYFRIRDRDYYDPALFISAEALAVASRFDCFRNRGGRSPMDRKPATCIRPLQRLGQRSSGCACSDYENSPYSRIVKPRLDVCQHGVVRPPPAVRRERALFSIRSGNPAVQQSGSGMGSTPSRSSK